jgi:zinc transport system substrate-binding protein
MLKQFAAMLSITLFILLFVVPFTSADQKLKVVATIFPLYDFAREVGGDRIDASMLLPPGVEAHTFEPRPQDIVRLNKADVFLYTGQFMEPWAADLLKGVTNKGLVAVDTSTGISLMDEEEHGEAQGEEHGEEPPEGHAHHGHEGKDPHIWLDPVLAQTMVDTIAQAFSQKDPLNSAFYQANAESYKARLKDLDARFAATLSMCQIRTIIYAGHFAFGYFAKRYDLDHVSPYKGFSPDAEPAPKSIKEIIDTIKSVGSNTIYYEELIDPKVARMISGETGARLELLHGAHNVAKDKIASLSYLKIMEANLPKLKEGLECQ